MTKKDVVALFQSARIDATLAHRVYREHGAATFSNLTRDPYTTLFGLNGFTVNHADKISKHLNKPLEAIVVGHIMWIVLKQPSPFSTVKMRVQTSLDVDALTMAGMMKTLTENQQVVLMDKYLLHPQDHQLLCDVASEIRDRCDSMNNEHYTMKWAFEEVECGEEQKNAMLMVATNRLSVITGGPGCGKSWVVRQMLEKFPNARVTAPTGRAARNADGKTVHYFKTIQDSQKGKLGDVDLIIVDEASMLSAYLMKAVFKMARNDAHIVLVGDSNQLPPIQTGHVLRDILASGKVPVARLTNNVRSVVPLHAFCDDLLKGRVTILEYHNDTRTPISFIECNSTDDMLNALPRTFPHIVLTPHNATRVKMNKVLQLFARGMQATNFSLDVRCVSPFGCLTLHQYAIARVEPSKVIVVDEHSGASEEMTYAEACQCITPFGRAAESGTVIQKMDTVIITRNTAGLCNGDIVTYVGDDTVRTSDGEKRKIQSLVNTDPGFALGYCITVHKAQGSEFDTVVIPICNVSAWTKTLLYTAVTRAKDRVIFLGSKRDLQCILTNSERHVPPFLRSVL